ncbi:MAG: MucB/RseB C-terminal domain-containing protein [Chromatiales bacterium]|nr:MucB/RseB C-terminal domain-containing protein [Chromatiales bacterium]
MRQFWLLCLCLWISQPGYLRAEDSSRYWMERMAMAVDSFNYQGAYIRMNDDEMETLEIFHRVDDSGEVTLRLVSLDGAGREIVSDSEGVKCYMPDKKSVLVERADPNAPLRSHIGRFTGQFSDNYRVVDCDRCKSADWRTAQDAGGCGSCMPGKNAEQRMLSMDTVMLAITPGDAYRYGYRLWLDRGSAFPIKTQVLNEKGEVIEQVRFTRLIIGKTVAASSVQSDIDTSDYEWVYSEQKHMPEKRDSRWRAAALPPGFMLTRVAHDGDEGEVESDEHLVFSDGMASVSVFVEQGENPGVKLGLSRLGGANAYSTHKDGYYVTAMGEVPPAAVEMIARHMEPMEGSQFPATSE